MRQYPGDDPVQPSCGREKTINVSTLEQKEIRQDVLIMISALLSNS